jgi:hypothetical protein
MFHACRWYSVHLEVFGDYHHKDEHRKINTRHREPRPRAGLRRVLAIVFQLPVRPSLGVYVSDDLLPQQLSRNQ